MSRTVCRFWQQGNCRYGNACKFEHPGQNSNRFGVFGGGGSSYRPGDRNSDTPPYSLSAASIKNDLTDDTPPWILSAYGPGKDAPDQLFGGYPLEQSFEEVRLHYMKGALAGNPQGALSEIEGLYQQAQARIQNARGNIDGAIKFITDAASKHPNRLDICRQGTAPGGANGAFAIGVQRGSTPFGAASSQPNNPFGGTSGATSSAFGQPSGLGQKPNPFGTPSFGQPSQPSSNAFGQPSQPSAGTSAFGRPSQPSMGAFGQPSQPAGGSAFGQPSSLGGSGGSAFGQASSMGQKPNPFGTPAFGQASQPTASSAPAFGQPSQPSAFGQPSQVGGGSAFGQASSLGQKPNPFSGGTTSANPFASGNPSSNNTSSGPFRGAVAQTGVSPFAQASAQSTMQGGGSAFGQPSTAPSPFGQPSQPSAPAFGAPSGGQSTGTTAFGQPSAPNPHPFGQPATSTSGAANPFGKPTTASPFINGTSQPTGFGPQSATSASAPLAAAGTGPYGPNATRQHPTIESYSSRDAMGRLGMFKGKAVSYAAGKDGAEHPVIRNFDGTNTRIWFPDGPPMYYKDTEAEDSAYDDTTKGLYDQFMKTGKFVAGMMPELAPKREWCTFDF